MLNFSGKTNSQKASDQQTARVAPTPDKPAPTPKVPKEKRERKDKSGRPKRSKKSDDGPSSSACAAATEEPAATAEPPVIGSTQDVAAQRQRYEELQQAQFAIWQTQFFTQMAQHLGANPMATPRAPVASVSTPGNYTMAGQPAALRTTPWGAPALPPSTLAGVPFAPYVAGTPVMPRQWSTATDASPTGTSPIMSVISPTPQKKAEKGKAEDKDQEDEQEDEKMFTDSASDDDDTEELCTE